MPRKILGFNGFVDFFAYQQHRQKHGTVELYIGEGFTPEEEDREVKKAFYEIANDFGMPHIHTLKIVHDDGRPPYYVHVSNVEWE